MKPGNSYFFAVRAEKSICDGFLSPPPTPIQYLNRRVSGLYQAVRDDLAVRRRSSAAVRGPFEPQAFCESSPGCAALKGSASWPNG
jgi:hypothetical protein